MRCFYVLKKWSSAKLSLNRDLSLNKMSLNQDCTVLFIPAILFYVTKPRLNRFKPIFTQVRPWALFILQVPPAPLMVLGMDQIMMNVRLLPWPDVKIFLNSRLMVLTDHPNAAGIYQSVIPKTHFQVLNNTFSINFSI